MTNEIPDREPDYDAVEAWRRELELELEVEVEVEVEVPGEDEVLDDSAIDESEFEQVQAHVLERLGIAPRANLDALIAGFFVDLDEWRTGASDLALARKEGSIVPTKTIAVPEMARAGLGGVVDVEIDLDENGRICDLALLVPESSDAPETVSVLLIEPDGVEHRTTLSAFGLARFSGLRIPVASGARLRFEVRR